MKFPSIVPAVLLVAFLVPASAGAVSTEDGKEGCAVPVPLREYLSQEICARVREEAAVRFLPASLKPFPGRASWPSRPARPVAVPGVFPLSADLVPLLPPVAAAFDVLGESLPALSQRFGAAWNGEAVSFRESRRLIADLRAVVKRVRVRAGSGDPRELAPDPDDHRILQGENGICSTCDLRKVLGSHFAAQGRDPAVDRSEAPVY